MSRSASPAPAARIDELESLRGVAALLVVLYHLPHWHRFLDDLPIVSNGDLMVPLFFVLSGFVIQSAYGSRIGSWSELGRFQFLRLGRLYPVHLLFVVLFLGVELSKAWMAARAPMALEETPFSRNSPLALLEQLLLVQAIGPTGHALSFNGPAWSISVESATYLAFGVSVLALGERSTRLFAVAAIASLAALALGRTGGFDLLLSCFAGFFVGCLTAWATRRLPRSLPGWIPAAMATLLVVHLARPAHRGPDLAIYALAALLVAAIVLSPGSALGRVLRRPALVRLGTISYSIYMSHMFVIWCESTVLKRLLHRPMQVAADGSQVPALGPIEAAAAATLALALVLLLSSLIHRYVETPCRERSRRLVQAAPLAAAVGPGDDALAARG